MLSEGGREPAGRSTSTEGCIFFSFLEVVQRCGAGEGEQPMAGLRGKGHMMDTRGMRILFLIVVCII